MAALSQLSYGPLSVRPQCSAELEIIGPANADPLVVLRRRQPEPGSRMAVEDVRREEKGAVEFSAVGGDDVDLVATVRPSYDAVPSSPRRGGRNHDNVALPPPPLALDTQKSHVSAKEQVPAKTVVHR